MYLPQAVYQQLCELSRIAYEGILHDQQVIFSDLPEDFETLGLMHCSQELYADEGVTVSYNFLHLTVQEYLAAFHLSQQPVDEQIELLREDEGKVSHYHRQHHFHMVLLFLCGIRNFTGYSNEVINTLCLVEPWFGCATQQVTLNTLHFLFEAQNDDVIANLLGSSDIQLHKQFRSLTPFDCFVLGYCMFHSNCTWKIDISDCYLGNEGLELLVRGATEEETHCTGGISEMDLSNSDITSEGAKHLAHLIPHMPHLKSLKLSHNLISKGASPLLASLSVLNSLQHLSLSGIEIGLEDCQALSKLLASSQSLKELGISLTSEAVELIIGGFHRNTTLKKLDMEDSNVSLQNTTSLASVLRANHTLLYLGLGHCSIDSDGACQLASVLCINDKLQTMYMDSNPIGIKGATAFATMLRTNQTLVDLNLGHSNIDSGGACQLASALCANDTLQSMYLQNNPF